MGLRRGFGVEGLAYYTEEDPHCNLGRSSQGIVEGVRVVCGLLFYCGASFASSTLGT